MTALRTLLVGWALGAVVHACVTTDSTSDPVRIEYVRECELDEDCGLVPLAITCCGECDPAPPFRAAPRTEIDAVLLDLETECSQSARGCEPPACSALPANCTARAVCRAGMCTVEQSDGCGAYYASM